MVYVYLFTQNTRLDTFDMIKERPDADKNVFLTTHYLFENERKYLEEKFKNCKFITFADLASDKELEEIDKRAYEKENIDYEIYLSYIKKYKNELICKKLNERFNDLKGYILSSDNDLGLMDEVWRKNGFQRSDGRFYHVERRYTKDKVRQWLANNDRLKKICHRLKKKNKLIFDPSDIYVAYRNEKKYVFIGSMHRISYRLNLDFKQSNEECKKLNEGVFEDASKCQYLSTWHEHHKCQIPDEAKYDVRWVQDGYLPPNYSHDDFSFKPKNVTYYVWDKLGAQLYLNKKLPVELIPFRKKLFMPDPIFHQDVKKILVVASGSGDWTALKNRSDDDLLVEAFVRIAEMFPEIKIVYRCHPTWTHPLNVGINAIDRVAELFSYMDLPNLYLSSNIPIQKDIDGFQYSFSRSLLDEDLEDTDLVFGEHSISMVDAAFKKIPFCSVNLTKRRDFFIGMSALGFPHCTTIDSIAEHIRSISSEECIHKYKMAVKAYNQMTESDKV